MQPFFLYYGGKSRLAEKLGPPQRNHVIEPFAGSAGYSCFWEPNLNGQVNRSQIKRRMTDTWGDRSTLERTIQHVLRSVRQWGLLRDGPVKGSLIAAPRRIPVSDEINELLFHAVLLSHGSGLPLAQLSSHPALFPFDAHLNSTKLRQGRFMRVVRQGDQTDFVELAVRKA
jgi:hypothetical protein